MFQVRVRINPADAIRAGRSKFGVVAVEVTDQNLESLEGELREELVRIVASGEIVGDGVNDGPIQAPEFDQLAGALRRRAEAHKQAEAASRAAEEAARIAAARSDEEEVVRKREYAAKEAVRQKAIKDWVEEHGDDSQQERLREGLLPEEEILESIVNEVFENLDDQTRYDPIRLEQACDCLCARHVKFTQGPPPTVDGNQFRVLRDIRENAPPGALVETVLHRAACPACSCVPLARLAARVTIEWNGWLLAREYLLG